MVKREKKCNEERELCWRKKHISRIQATTTITKATWTSLNMTMFLEIIIFCDAFDNATTWHLTTIFSVFFKSSDIKMLVYYIHIHVLVLIRFVVCWIQTKNFEALGPISQTIKQWEILNIFVSIFWWNFTKNAINSCRI